MSHSSSAVPGKPAYTTALYFGRIPGWITHRDRHIDKGTIVSLRSRSWENRSERALARRPGRPTSSKRASPCGSRASILFWVLTGSRCIILIRPDRTRDVTNRAVRRMKARVRNGCAATATKSTNATRSRAGRCYLALPLHIFRVRSAVALLIVSPTWSGLAVRTRGRHQSSWPIKWHSSSRA